jgi:hypothetical protein
MNAGVGHAGSLTRSVFYINPPSEVLLPNGCDEAASVAAMAEQHRRGPVTRAPFSSRGRPFHLWGADQGQAHDQYRHQWLAQIRWGAIDLVVPDLRLVPSPRDQASALKLNAEHVENDCPLASPEAIGIDAETQRTKLLAILRGGRAAPIIPTLGERLPRRAFSRKLSKLIPRHH